MRQIRSLRDGRICRITTASEHWEREAVAAEMDELRARPQVLTTMINENTPTTKGINMPMRNFTDAEIEEQDLDEVSSEPWRHGRRATYVFELDGIHWRFTANVHHDDGIQLEGTVTATQVHQVERTVKVWEPA